LLFDGSPLYVQSQISHDMKHLPLNASQEQVKTIHIKHPL